MDKKSAKKQFDDMTSMLGLEHTFPFDTNVSELSQ